MNLECLDAVHLQPDENKRETQNKKLMVFKVKFLVNKEKLISKVCDVNLNIKWVVNSGLNFSYVTRYTLYY